MNELNCKSCNNTVICDVETVAVTCSSCVNARISGIFTTTNEEITEC
jgi:hypothetical protein